ncbi:aldehyde dehydrogenase family protein [Mesorhizobium sp. VK24D]|uniref:Aldehyde dehydrogenase family protein n=1 Tax=Mesorhizobium album TaxID=3072314 RepID=A0ABU4Y6M6_9HYPH|nr:aldehyde dehydrogenase family protein [Mesorhizobium sp. VK24D]MDX8482553.1 aldehyde dehydrogenase family protein [Mesorhizobium sp. VK24D]
MSKREYGIWINGGSELPAGCTVFERMSPSTGECVARVHLAGTAEVERAIALAKETFKDGAWKGAPASERGKILLHWADLITKELDPLSRIEADEAGKTIAAARGEIEWSVELLRYAASLAWSIPGRVVNHEGAEKLGLVTYEPLPVIGMILPWNFPSVTLFQKLPYALVAGCSVVIKPSELTAGTAIEYARLAKEAGIPDGVLAVLPGVGEVVGEAMCLHPAIDMISFTGSTAVGRKIASLAGQSLKKVALELGGKGANIVFADANLDAAVGGALAAFTINQGEECCAGGRLLVEEAIASDFVAMLAEKAKALKLGTPDDVDADLGPMIHEHHHRKVLGYIQKAKDEGATLVVGGGAPREVALESGYFIEPTIFTGVDPSMTIFKEEIFGPVLGVTTFRSVSQAIELANLTHYGLANGVWTSNIDTAMAVSSALESGFVYVNSYLETVPQLPFGGRKSSGLGRENGPEGLLEFMQAKSTFVRMRPSV